MVPLLLNKYCRAEQSFCWLITSCNPWTVLVRAASICSGQRQVNIWSSWSALVSWDCLSHVPLAQTNHWFAGRSRTQSRGCRAPHTPGAEDNEFGSNSCHTNQTWHDALLTSSTIHSSGRSWTSPACSPRLLHQGVSFGFFQPSKVDTQQFIKSLVNYRTVTKSI